MVGCCLAATQDSLGGLTPLLRVLGTCVHLLCCSSCVHDGTVEQGVHHASLTTSSNLLASSAPPWPAVLA